VIQSNPQLFESESFPQSSFAKYFEPQNLTILNLSNSLFPHNLKAHQETISQQSNTE